MTLYHIFKHDPQEIKHVASAETALDGLQIAGKKAREDEQRHAYTLEKFIEEKKHFIKIATFTPKEKLCSFPLQF